MVIPSLSSSCWINFSRRQNGQPGKFTRRAVLNGRMDLLQAEAVAAAIDAGSASGVGWRFRFGGRLKLPLEDLQRGCLS